MGTSEARKLKRKLNNVSKPLKEENASVDEGKSKKQKRNRGRSEYRNVTRTSRRPVHDEDEEEEEEQELNQSESDDEEGEDQDGNDQNGQAYNALLNLLTAEQEIEEAEEEEEDDEEEEEEENSDEVSENEGEEEDEDHIAGVLDEEEAAEDQEEHDEDQLSDNEQDLDSEDESDPFEYHFDNSPEDYLKSSVEALGPNKWKNVKSTYDSHSCISSYPPTELSEKYSNISKDHSLKNYQIKNRFVESFNEQYDGENFTENNDIAKQLLDPIFSYHDVLYPYNTFENIQDYRKLYILHTLNHVNRTTNKILKNNNRLRLQSERIANGKLDIKDEKEYRDQGFTRPKVLILLPNRNQCYKVVQDMIKISGSEQVENHNRFKNDFYQDADVPDNKPDDFKDLFEGNANDFFCLGLKVNRKSIKLYSSFYGSDIIIASPIGLQLILENPDKKKSQNDFLSSIEVLVVDQAQAIELQNWEHVLTILKYVNKIPEKFHDTDFSRVRMWSIEDQAKYFTQNLIFTEYNTPNVNNLLTRSKNIFGKHRFRSIVSNKDSALSKVGLKIKQIFTRFESTSPFNEPDERFNHFKSNIIPSITKSTSYEDGLLLYIPSYTDFLRIKNYLHNKTSFMFSDVNEYSTQQQLGRSRALFQQGRSKILLYTERLHHYRRFDLKGIKNIFMYGVPTNPLFYSEIVSSIGRSVFEEIADLDISTVRCLYSKWDALALERIVGSERAPLLTHGQNEFYEFR